MACRKTPTKLYAEESPRNAPQVHFSQHFTKDFLTQYGTTTDRTVATDSDFKRKLQPITCQWLCCPSVAATELAKTLNQNMKKLKHVKLLASASEHIHQLRSKLDSVSKVILLSYFQFQIPSSSG